MQNQIYPDAQKFSEVVGIPVQNLIGAFELEREFHKKIKQEDCKEVRKKLYVEIYAKVHPLLDTVDNDEVKQAHHDAMIRIFADELSGKDVLDVGCGDGLFLMRLSQSLQHGRLCGIDVTETSSIDRLSYFEFVAADVTEFSLDREFDVVWSDNVMEHISHQDLPGFLSSIRGCLASNGIFILMLPNRLFGPHDVSRVLDFSNTGKVLAQGTHLSEMTYHEVLAMLREHGFRDFKSVLPIPRLDKWGFLRKIRVSAGLSSFLEWPLWLAVLRRIRLRGRAVIKLPIILLCRA
jgi:2-polyprenyl-3-methyl-5-hydroxy-6-metoxy-1,4-benzoquinol methylase